MTYQIQHKEVLDLITALSEQILLYHYDHLQMQASVGVDID